MRCVGNLRHSVCVGVFESFSQPQPGTRSPRVKKRLLYGKGGAVMIRIEAGAFSLFFFVRS